VQDPELKKKKKVFLRETKFIKYFDLVTPVGKYSQGKNAFICLRPLIIVGALFISVKNEKV
jgi:hypothetical protein